MKTVNSDLHLTGLKKPIIVLFRNGSHEIYMLINWTVLHVNKYVK